MKRQEAIKILDRYDLNFCDIDGNPIPPQDLAEACEMAIEVLEQENRMTRHEAIETLTASDYFWLRPSEDEAEALNIAIKVLEQEPKTGYWIGIDDYPHEDWECDNCGYVIEAFENPNDFRYCPNCGARMESEE